MAETDPSGEGGTRKRAVFLSYARADRSTAKKLVDMLESAGITVWWDGLIEGGAKFSEVTERALEGAEVVVVLWSKTSTASHWVHDEATRGRDRRRLVPVSIDGSEAPLGFRQFQVIDVSQTRLKLEEPECQQVIHAIEAFLGSKAELPPVKDPRWPKIGRRSFILGAGVAVVAGGGIYLAASRFLAPIPADASVAVLPFANLSGDPGQEYFSDGLSEELRATLSQNRQLAVAAQTSSNSFRDRQLNAVVIARRLNVAFILDGSVRRSGEVLRITAQLIDGKEGFEKWSRSFDRKLADVFSVQTEIALLVADALAKELSSGEGASLKRIGGTNNPVALDAYLKGKAAYASALSEEDDRSAMALFEQAIAIDPEYAVAHAARSRSLTVIANSYVNGSELTDYYDRSIEAARRALQIVPDLPEANASLGFTLFNGRLDARAAQEPYERSYRDGFGNADILSSYANFAGRIGDFGSARLAVARAAELDPLNATVFRNAGAIEFDARDFDAARQALTTALSLNPGIGSVNRMLGDMALISGDIETAREYYEKEPLALSRACGLAMVGGSSDERGGAVDRSEESAGLGELAGLLGDNSLYQQAQILAQRGDSAEALKVLDRAYAAGDSGLVLARNDPLLDSLRSEPGFSQLLQKIGFAIPLTN